jgi:CO dehydrogenase/acetyl-CoA synthase epsilon subunit
MPTFDAQIWTRRIREHRNPLLAAGEDCKRIVLQGRPLVDYAVDIAAKLGCPVAATGNLLPAVKERNAGLKAKKMWLAEIFRYLEDDWAEPLLADRPDLLILIGYRPAMVQGLAAGARGVHLVHLGPGRLPAAHLSVEETTLEEWKRQLDDLLKALE